MKEILLIKTSESEKIKSLLTEKKLDYQIIYNETIQDKKVMSSQTEFEKQLAKDYQAWANDPDEWKDADGE